MVFRFCALTIHTKCSFNLSTIKDWDLLPQRHFCVVFARLLCSAGITNVVMKMHFTLAVAPPFVHPMTSFRPRPRAGGTLTFQKLGSASVGFGGCVRNFFESHAHSLCSEI